MFMKKSVLWLTIALTLIFMVLAFLRVGFVESLELTAYDLRMKLRAGEADTKTDIVIVDIDDESIARLGRWPWPRSLVAGMIDKLKAAGVRIIGLNIIFSEPEVRESLKLLDELESAYKTGLGDRQEDPAVKTIMDQLAAARERMDTDKQLADSIRIAGNVVLPVLFDMGPYPAEETDFPEYIMTNGFPQVQKEALGYLMPARKASLPIPPFAQGSGGLGFINVFPDRDGMVRKDVLLSNYKGLPFPSYSLKLAMLALGIEREMVRIITPGQGREGLQMGGAMVPTTPNFGFYISFTDTGVFPRFSFYDVLNDKFETSVLKDKIVLIGVSAAGVDIPRATPVDSQMHSAEFSANVLQNLLAGGFITRGDMMDIIELLVLLLAGLFLVLVLPRLGILTGTLVSAGLLLVLAGAGVYLFVGPGIWFKMTYPMLLIALGYAAVTASRYTGSGAVRDKVEGESAEVNRMLGLNFQNQGQLDMAFDKFRRVPVDDGMKEILYNLAQDYERNRLFSKAAQVYQHIRQHDAKYRDIDDRIRSLGNAPETMASGLGGSHPEEETLLIAGDARPTLGRYEVLKELGRGAMGVVYQGKDPKIGRVTAIKTIRFTEEYDEDEAVQIKEQFFREAETAGLLSHPSIVTIYDAGEDHDLSYIAMEYLEGTDLKEYARPDNLLPVREVVRLIADVADALGYAHSKGVVHRDIKPANIMRLNNGTAKVTDFGIARATASSKTKTGVVKGTPFYMSPEQITGKKVDGRTDIYSLGVVLYELLTGVQPFTADDLTALIYNITNEDPEPLTNLNPRVPRALQQIVEKAMTKDRERRYRKAEKMAEHLRIVGRKMDEMAARKKRTT